MMYQTEDSRKFHRDITAGLIRSRLVNLGDYDNHLAKSMDGGASNASPSSRVE